MVAPLFHDRLPGSTGRLAWATLLVLALAGCASPDKVAPGSTVAQTIEQFGRPTVSYPMPGGERLIYSRQPFGREAYAVDVDAQGRVVSARQVLQASEFQRIRIDEWTRDDVRKNFGPPAEVGRVMSFNGEIWTYRWANPFYMLYHVYFDPQGVVRRAHEQVDLINDPEDRHGRLSPGLRG